VYRVAERLGYGGEVPGLLFGDAAGIVREGSAAEKEKLEVRSACCELMREKGVRKVRLKLG